MSLELFHVADTTIQPPSVVFINILHFRHGQFGLVVSHTTLPISAIWSKDQFQVKIKTVLIRFQCNHYDDNMIL